MRSKIRETKLSFRGEFTKRAKTTEIIIHHIGNIDRDVSIEEIHKWHLENGWAGCGYHFVVRKDGTIERGRPVNVIGSHCKGSNANSIGINVVGDFMKAKPSEAQIKSLVILLADLCEQFKIPKERKCIVGHRERMQTECPGNNFFAMLGEIIEKVKKTK